MSRSILYFGIVAALILAAFLNTLRSEVFVEETLTISVSTPVVETESLPTPLESELNQEPVAQATPAPKKEEPLRKEKKTTTPVSAPLPVVETPPQEVGDLDDASSALRKAIVNIICHVPPGTRLHSISGSGVFIDEKGIILTNSHIAQYFLYEDRGASCTIRTGSPATDAYEASPIFISSAWVNANKDILIKDSPIGTGEYDYAFLAVTKSATHNPLPKSFPFLPLGTVPPVAGTPIVIGAYGAQFLGSNQIQSSLFPIIVFGSVKEIFTFASNTIDVLSLGGSAAAQQGSSGGAVIDALGTLVGTITTSTIDGATENRTLDAISASYIRSAYAGETGEALDILLARPTALSIAKFFPSMATLEAILVAYLP